MDITNKKQVALVENAARAVFPNFSELEACGGVAHAKLEDGQMIAFNPLDSFEDALFVAQSLGIRFSGKGDVYAEAKININPGDGIFNGVYYGEVEEGLRGLPLLCIVITRSAAAYWDWKYQQR